MSLSNKVIVSIDDTASIRGFMRVLMEDEGAVFHEAENGAKGIELCEQIKPDIVVLDLGLPDMDGLEVLPILKDQENAPKVAILSVRKSSNTIEKAKSLGADGYLAKPFVADSILEMLETVVN